MKHWLRGVVAGLAIAAAGSAAAGNADDAFLAALDAYRNGDRAALERAGAELKRHPLGIYLEYWRLRARLEEGGTSEIGAFFDRHPGTYLADRLRTDWLKLLGKAGDWALFDAHLGQVAKADTELNCYAMASALARGDNAALDQAHALWLDSGDLPAACMAVMDKLAARGRLSVDDVWRRIRRQIEAKRLGAATSAAAYLPDRDAPDRVTLASLMADPERHLKRQAPNFAATRHGRELAMMALARLAQADPQKAAAAFEGLKPRLSGAERAYVYGQLGWHGARRHLPEALAWYRAADDTPMSAEQAEWFVRVALRAGNWRVVREAAEALPASVVADPTWIYWHGRALREAGRKAEASAEFERIAGVPSFYGVLAAEELGRSANVPAKAPAPTPAEIAAVEATPDIVRALTLFRLDLRLDGIREWNWAMRGRDDRFLLAAAQLANRREIFDRAISSADRTVDEHDYTLRYLAPFRDRVEPKARELDLDDAWVYGLMRQESRFVMNARSSAGASGLMQLMPATARWVARKIGLKNFRLSEVNDMDTNVLLGTSYLKMVLATLDNHPVLASAAYNAGPGRARRWRDGKPLEGAIYAETIPFDETRDYVKKVMANAYFYAAVFGAPSVPLKTRLGTITPGSGGGNTDLP